jgi:prolyl oligopeptidase PreP (S9A serine peptidase family)
VSRAVSAEQALAIARSMAARAGYLITQKEDTRRDGSRVPAWVVYRKATPQNVRVAKRTSPRAVLSLIQTITGK